MSHNRLVMPPERERPKFRKDMGSKSGNQDVPGYLYLVKGPHGYYKIGYSADPDVRVDKLALTVPFELEIIHLLKVENMVKAESYLKAVFARRHLRGEWYRFDAEDIDRIMTLEDPSNLVIDTAA
jgi:hypothetical protein